MSKTKVSALGEHIGYLMRQISNKVSGDFEIKMHNRGIVIAEWVVMRIMFDYNSITHTQIVEASGLTKGAITKTLTKLLDKGFIQKTESSTDARSQILSLSQKARKLVPILADLADQNEEGYFSILNKKEQAILKGLLQKIIQTKHITDTPIN